MSVRKWNVCLALGLALMFGACKGDSLSNPQSAQQAGTVEATATSATTATTAGPDTTATSAATGTDVAAGDYVCDYRPTLYAVPEQKGTIEMHRDGTYKYLENGDSGRYEMTGGGSGIKWVDGPLADKEPLNTVYKVNQHTTQIDILFTADVEWSCGHNL